MKYFNSNFGRHFGKRDLERVGYFDDTTLTFDKYTKAPGFRENVTKGRQLHPGPPTDLFDKKAQRIFTGEALSEPWKQAARDRMQRERAKIGGVMKPPSPAKKHATPGDWHGCFNKPTYLSPALKTEVTKKKHQRELPNCKIKPNPLGGPGYVHITINPYPSHSSEPYDQDRKLMASEGRFLSASAPLEYFPPNPYLDDARGPTYVRPPEVGRKFIGPPGIYVPFPKEPGGNHAGCFNKFPEYRSNPYGVKADSAKTEEGRWVGGGPPTRSKYTTSIIDRVTNISCNANNYLEYRERVFPMRHIPC